MNSMETRHQDLKALVGAYQIGVADRFSRIGSWLARSRAHRVICLVVGIYLLNAFDLLLTIHSHKEGFLTEQNPIAVQLLPLGTLPIIAYKTILCGGGSISFLLFRRHRVVELAAIVVFLAYLFIAIRWQMCYEVYLMSASHLQLADVESFPPGP